MTFDPIAMCRILNEEQVDYVVLGGFAANRLKDVSALPYLESLRDELRRRAAEQDDR